MPVGLRRRHTPTLDACVEACVNAHRSAFLEVGTNSDSDLRNQSFRVSRYKRGYLSSMYRVGLGSDEYLLAVKHHDGNALRARRAMEVLHARDGRYAPRPIMADLSGRFVDDAVIVTELVSPRMESCEPLAPKELARLIADIHTDTRLAMLPIDSAGPRNYSLMREFEEESSVIPTFAPGALREQMEAMQALLMPFAKSWAPSFSPNELVYCHGDLPHHHVFRTARGPVIIHWEFSRRSHPSREFGRTACLDELSETELVELLEAYHELVPFRVSMESVRVQEIFEHFYGCIHTVFWMDRSGYDVVGRHLKATLGRIRLTLAYLRIRVEQMQG
jgi:hypothetical protein